MNTARDYVTAIVCGYTRAVIQRRLLCMLRDESDAGNRTSGIFTVSGYVAFATQWSEFAEQWQRALKQEPSFAYFKSAAVYSNKWRKENGKS